MYPRQEILNTAQVTKYTNTGTAGAPNFVQDQSLYEDTALVIVAEPGLSKTADSSSAPSTVSSDLTIGEQVTFEVVVTLPEGQTTNLTLTDDIPDGFRYEEGSLTVDSVGAAVSLGSPQAVIPASPHTFVQGEDVSISWGGSTTVSGASSDSERQVILTLDATVVDHVSNDWQDPSKTNTVALDWDENPFSPLTEDASLTIVEPDLIVTKSISPNPAYGGQTVTVTLTIENQGTSDAFDAEVSDPLDGDVFDTAGGATDTTASLNGFTFGYSDPTVTYSGGTIEAGDSQVFSFTVDILNLVLVGSTYPNIATADYTSLPGDEDDERDYQDTGEQDLAISRTGIGKSIVTTSQPNGVTSGTDVVIGEVVTYQETLDLPVSTTSDSLEVVDNLPSNVSYIAGTAEISRISSTVTSTAFASWAATDGDFASIALTGSPDPLEFDMGGVTNSDSTGQSIKFRFDVVVDNEEVNQRGTNIFNRATASFVNDDGQTITVRSNRVTSRVKVPALLVTKTATPASAIGGDTVSFTVIAENQSLSHAGPAFELNVYDPLDPYYGPISGVAWVVSGSGVTVTDNTVGSTLDMDINRLDPGESVAITFSADLTAGIPHGVTVPNTSLFTGTSLPGDNGTGDASPGASGDPTGERTGTGGVNDLRSTSSQEVTIDVPTVNKSIVDEQSSHAIGETISYQVVIGVPTGFSECLRFIDILPDGVTYEPGTLKATVPSAITVENTPLTEGNPTFFSLTGQEVQLEFGEVSASSSDNMVITYNVVVDNTLDNQNGTPLINSVVLQQRDPDTGDCISLGTSATETIVGEPYIEVDKQVVSSTAGIEAGDEVQYQVTLENTGNETAYGLSLTDLVSPGNAFADISASSVSASFSPEPTFDEGALTMGPFDLAPGESVTLLFTAEIGTLALGTTVTNTASIEFSSQPGGQGRTGDGTSDQDDAATLSNYNDEDDASFQMESFVGLEKDLCPCLPDHVFAIGQRVVFRIQVEILEATTEDVIVTDTLPAGLVPLPGDAQIIAGNAGMSFEDPDNPGNPQPDYNVPDVSGQQLTFELGNVVNPDNGNDLDDYVVIDVHAYVENVNGNQNGDMLTNEVQVTWREEGEIQSLSDTEDAPIVEPNLEVIKEVGLSELTIGDEVTYTVTVRHTGDSTADAHDIMIVDTLGENMDYVPGSCSLPAGQVNHSAGTPETLTFQIPLLSLADHESTYTYRCILEYDESLVNPQVLQQNDVLLTWTSLPGDQDGERTGDEGVGGDLNDYADTDSEDVTPIIRTTIDATKTVSDLNGGDLVGGDILEYIVVLENTMSTAEDVVFTDPIPAHTSYVAGSLSCDKPGALIDDSSDPLVVEIGDMAEDEVITITFRVRVYPQSPSGTAISNQGVVDSDDTTPDPTDDPDDPTSDTDPTEIIVDRPLPVVGGEVIRPDKSELLRIRNALSDPSVNGGAPRY
ncbi:MAG: isopeptide-forming domain-containing fimbrial protein [Chloroflexota bacterium]